MQPALSISLHSGNPREEQAREQLHRLLATYDLERWLFTRDILIRSFTHPHSHPVLTLNTRQINHDEGQLGTFLHEQFHWHAVASLERVERAMAELRVLFPDAPVGTPEGGKDEYSTYLHLVICAWELDALRILLGDEPARDVIAGRGYYTWVYRRVLDDEGSLRKVLARHDLALP